MESFSLLFYKNCKKVNLDKFHHLLVVKETHEVSVCNENILRPWSEKPLGVGIDNKLTSEEHVQGLCDFTKN